MLRLVAECPTEIPNQARIAIWRTVVTVSALHIAQTAVTRRRSVTRRPLCGYAARDGHVLVGVRGGRVLVGVVKGSAACKKENGRGREKGEMGDVARGEEEVRRESCGTDAVRGRALVAARDAWVKYRRRPARKFGRRNAVAVHSRARAGARRRQNKKNVPMTKINGKNPPPDMLCLNNREQKTGGRGSYLRLYGLVSPALRRSPVPPRSLSCDGGLRSVLGLVVVVVGDGRWRKSSWHGELGVDVEERGCAGPSGVDRREREHGASRDAIITTGGFQATDLRRNV